MKCRPKKMVSSASKIALSRVLNAVYRNEMPTNLLNKVNRQKIVNDFKDQRSLNKFAHLKEKCPAMYEEIRKALDNKKNIQPGVFSECAYSQTLAAQMQLSTFEIHLNNKFHLENLSSSIREKIENLKVRYSFSSQDSKTILLQAGGAEDVDCAIIFFDLDEIIKIEFKESRAKISEPDLPRYGEDGYIMKSEIFHKQYPQFESMLEEQIQNRLNVFEHLGRNVHNFSEKSLIKAVDENYRNQKFADLIITEDEQGRLLPIATNDIAKFAKLKGELRPTGRNSYPVWTPNKLIQTITEKSGKIKNEIAEMPISSLAIAKARGSNKISRYKISQLFFIRQEYIEKSGNLVKFKLINVEQNISSISVIIDLSHLRFLDLKTYYLQASTNV